MLLSKRGTKGRPGASGPSGLGVLAYVSEQYARWRGVSEPGPIFRSEEICIYFLFVSSPEDRTAYSPAPRTSCCLRHKQVYVLLYL